MEEAGALAAIITAIAALGGLVFGVYKWRADRKEVPKSSVEVGGVRLEFDPDSPGRSADVTPAQLPHKEHRDGRRAYRFKLRNMGPSYAKHVSVWLVDEELRPLSSRSIGMPLDLREEVEIALEVPEEVWSAEPEAKLMIEWFNDRGSKESEASNTVVRWDY